jgi:hypothetical protein
MFALEFWAHFHPKTAVKCVPASSFWTTFLDYTHGTKMPRRFILIIIIYNRAF